jgi:hypothetical protein
MSEVDAEEQVDAGKHRGGVFGTGVSRRIFITRGTITAAAVGVIGSVPGMSGLLFGASSEAPAVEGGAAEVEEAAAGSGEPLVAHLSDLQSGRISLFQGEREVVVESPTLARQLYLAARR